VRRFRPAICFSLVCLLVGGAIAPLAVGGVPAAVEQAPPEVTIEEVPVGIQYGDSFTVRGWVSVDGAGVEARGVPVVVTIGGRQVARVNTSGDGSFVARGRLPAGVPTGTQPVVVETAREDGATGAGSAMRWTTIDPSGTQLTARARQTAAGESRIRVDGRLTTTKGALVTGQPVVILFDGEPVAQTTTVEAGQFSTVVSVPESMVPEEGTVNDSVSVQFVGEESNLNGSQTTAAFALTSAAAGGRGGEGGEEAAVLPDDVNLGFGVGLALMGAALFGVFVYRPSSDSGTVETESDVTTATPESKPTDSAAVTTESDSAAVTTESDSAAVTTESDPLAEARAANDAADSRGVVLASYAAVRRELVSEGAKDETHWEFYSTYSQDDVDSDQLKALEILTNCFEQAAFSTGSVSETEASLAFRAADTILSASQSEK
jgi:hypothetical protein